MSDSHRPDEHVWNPSVTRPLAILMHVDKLSNTTTYQASIRQGDSAALLRGAEYARTIGRGLTDRRWRRKPRVNRYLLVGDAEWARGTYTSDTLTT